MFNSSRGVMAYIVNKARHLNEYSDIRRLTKGRLLIDMPKSTTFWSGVQAADQILLLEGLLKKTIVPAAITPSASGAGAPVCLRLVATIDSYSEAIKHPISLVF